jgi:hypothetical protein
MSRLTAAALLLCLLAGMGVANAKPLRQQQIITCDQRGCGPGGGEGVAYSEKHKRLGRATVSRSCLTTDTRALLEQAEAHFGVTFTLVSTCRPGAVIAGTNHPSEHRYGKAVDLLVPRGTSKAEVVKWFYAHARGVIMTYARMKHVHFDTGPYHTLACGGCHRVRVAHAQ